MTLKQLVFTHTTDCPNRNFKSEVDLDDVQGDVIVQFPKRAEDFTFFKIRDAASFKQHVMPSLIPKISSAAAVMKARENIAAFKSTGGSDLLPLEFVNIAFTYNGLKALGLNADELYASFDSNLDVLKKGQLACVVELGDPVENEVPKEWIDEFKNQHDQIHGVLLVAADSDTTLQKCRADIESKLGNFVQVVYKLQGQTRPGINKDHEHFGWKDGVSNPWLKGVFCECRKFPGQMEVERGNILVGHPGDNDRVDEADAVFPRPDWAKNGSYMAFRQYDQLVPEFHKWTADNAIKLNIPGMSPEQLKEKGAALRAAQLVGRWPSGLFDLISAAMQS
ncbi:unnamed protein product [Rhizoctonia solani]|uniref:DyP dimeric alpha+beta barrel domain-containing protein n=1 Tax=Rhizoctonia solani TaxID=456999 RepID=A0A8H2Y002_9AGAM|nr:unnamed protein product [Rhizoctonia solani]